MSDPILDLVSRHAWVPLAALAIGLLARAAKEPAVGSIFARVPRQHRPRVVLALGVISGVIDAVVRGTPWSTAVVFGLVSGALAMAGHGALGGVSPEPARGAAPTAAPEPPASLDVPPAAPSGPPTEVAAPPVTPFTATWPPRAEISGDWGPRPSGR